ncbi:MAG: YhcH/YjgK/YiaL family protein [Anaerolineae bacterium]|nr:MAG: YhcH/YjgK/YiaL family protein [Anaerolineae bacterium]
MIAGHLSAVSEQILTTSDLQTAFDFLYRKAWEGLPEGRFEIDGAVVWGMVQSYDTEPTPVQEIETHRHHIDLHFIVEGEETIHWIPSDHLNSDGVYDQLRDVWLTSLAGSLDQVTHLRLRAGELAVFFPSDGHWPRMASGTSARVKKILVKVPLTS